MLLFVCLFLLPPNSPLFPMLYLSSLPKHACSHRHTHPYTCESKLNFKRPVSLNQLNEWLHTSFQRPVTFGHNGVESATYPQLRNETLLNAVGLLSGLLPKAELLSPDLGWQSVPENLSQLCSFHAALDGPRLCLRCCQSSEGF